MTVRIKRQVEECKEEILEFVRTEKKTSIDKVEKNLEEKGIEATLENSSESVGPEEYHRIVYWISDNHLLIQGLEELISEGRINVEKCDSWRYGHKIGHPIATKIKQYSDLRWYPVLLSINSKNESSISKLEKEMNEKIAKAQRNSEITDKKQYVVSNNAKKIDAHCSYCIQNNIPYIVAKGKKYYTVQLDLDIIQSHKLTKDGENAIKYMAYWELLNNPKSIQKKYISEIGKTFIRIYPIRKEKLDEFCKKLFYLSEAWA